MASYDETKENNYRGMLEALLNFTNIFLLLIICWYAFLSFINLINHL